MGRRIEVQGLSWSQVSSVIRSGLAARVTSVLQRGFPIGHVCFRCYRSFEGSQHPVLIVISRSNTSQSQITKKETRLKSPMFRQSSHQTQKPFKSAGKRGFFCFVLFNTHNEVLVWFLFCFQWLIRKGTLHNQIKNN